MDLPKSDVVSQGSSWLETRKRWSDWFAGLIFAQPDALSSAFLVLSEEKDGCAEAIAKKWPGMT